MVSEGAWAVSQEVEWLFRESGLTAPAHGVDDELLLGALREHYGLDGRLTRLDTEKDATYRLRSSAPEAAGARVHSRPDPRRR